MKTKTKIKYLTKKTLVEMLWVPLLAQALHCNHPEQVSTPMYLLPAVSYESEKWKYKCKSLRYGGLLSITLALNSMLPQDQEWRWASSPICQSHEVTLYTWV